MIAWPPCGAQRALDEVRLSAEARVHAVADVAGAGLVVQVDLQRGVDRDHVSVATAIRDGSFVVSVRVIRTRGLRCTHS